ncbi:sphingoid long-chain bases kinase 1 [Quercus suber]|uniref:Sphingoid long-chain bases kinase 1 n=1 Tax=Quercus suber TaxID=58331 RepID=A0AAW0KZG4_QUESU
MRRFGKVWYDTLRLPHKVVAQEADGFVKFGQGDGSAYLFDPNIYIDGRILMQGGLIATDVFAVEWIQTGVIHFGMTVSYFGFVSDVLELSEKYQKRFGPLRYLVARFLVLMLAKVQL